VSAVEETAKLWAELGHQVDEARLMVESSGSERRPETARPPT